MEARTTLARVGASYEVMQPMMLLGEAMTSLEIAEVLCMSDRHDDVKRSIERLMDRGTIACPPTADVQERGGNNRTYSTKVYVFSGAQGKRDSIVVVARLSPEHTAALVDRWQFLEEKAAAGEVPLPGEGPALPTEPVKIAQLTEPPKNSLEAILANARMVGEQANQIVALLQDAVESRAERERQKIEQQRLAAEIQEVRTEIADIRQYQQNVAAIIATPVPTKPGGCEAMTALKSKFHKRYGLSGWVVDRVLTQLEGFRVVPKAYVQNGVRHEADGVTVVVDTRGNTIDAPGYLVYQAATCTSAMNEFIRECVRVSPCKVTHPALPGKTFNLSAGLAKGGK
ncbi:hypothetical protein R75465_02218 [Paraburkholderia aspalathi]|uniref:Rha family transcriptional regulator n=1 Tax=Paraburkholderia aspalathi TaxID=1324617 RepID=UPI001B2AD56F|nr:Rha family transcriptional regulator [Paraburkholderia aspalathi]CAE6739850.1 hypothetical protein R75465_02218 [Paraburkholderia aspalathi]